MTRPDLMPLAEEERADLLALLRQLTPAQWNADSLCTNWRVRDVATHIVSYDELSKAATVATFLRGGLRFGRVQRCRPGALPVSTQTASSTWSPATSARAVSRRASRAGSR
jgi:uncharacterized protein (TIGR03083 family)